MNQNLISFLVSLIISVAFVQPISADSTNLEDVTKECMEHNGAHITGILQVLTGFFPEDDPALKNLTFCIMNKMDYIKEDGTFNKEYIIDNMESQGETEANVNYVLNTCVNREKTPVLRAWEFFKCKYLLELRGKKMLPN